MALYLLRLPWHSTCHGTLLARALGLAINRVVWAASRLTAAGSRVPTMAGLACIPLIVHPIDLGVDWVLTTFLRPSYPDSRPDSARRT